MPEGPELRHMAEFVARISEQYGPFANITRSDLATHAKKHPEFDLPSSPYTIETRSRGKEVLLQLKADGKAIETLLFRMGMSGNFVWLNADEDIPKHAHLRFHSTSGVLCYEDPRRFGGWTLTSEFDEADRGPCILTQLPEFVRHVCANHDKRAFEQPICQLLLDQKYFNGFGNYIRAEVLHRMQIHPFEPGAEALSPYLNLNVLAPIINDLQPDGMGVYMLTNEQAEQLGFFGVAWRVFTQSLAILRKHGFGGGDDRRVKVFTDWLQCYTKLGRCLDNQKRTIWFDVDLKPSKAALLPKDFKLRAIRQDYLARRANTNDSPVKARVTSALLPGRLFKWRVQDTTTSDADGSNATKPPKRRKGKKRSPEGRYKKKTQSQPKAKSKSTSKGKRQAGGKMQTSSSAAELVPQGQRRSVRIRARRDVAQLK